LKAVFFCGGHGIRLHPSTVNVPKPLVNVGEQPILLHLMKAYAYYGHKDFILCLGYKGNEIKKYFLEFNDALSSDFIMRPGASQEEERIEIMHKSMQDWKITFADTGLNSNIGERLCQSKKYLEDEDAFLANYADALSNVDLNKLIDYAKKQDKIGCFITVRPPSSYHIVHTTPGNYVNSIKLIETSNLRINGGFFYFKKDIFDYIIEGEELVYEPFQRLIDDQQLVVYEHNGFWASMDTYKDKSKLDNMEKTGKAVWKVWQSRNIDLLNNYQLLNENVIGARAST
jgi:glucose-1-phosphate cytidylyltransferase